MSVTLRVLVLPAFDDIEGVPSEAEPWTRAYEFEHAIDVPGLSAPLRHTDRGLGLVPTGIGKTAAATTTAALCASDDVDVGSALVCSVGVAGGPPELPIGSVVLANHVVDWDDKCRFDPSTDGSGSVAHNPYTDAQGVFDLDAGLVSRAESLAEGVTLRDDGGGEGPGVVTGTNLCGDELWHGRRLAAEASWLVDEYGCRPYRATEMEDAGTARALERFGHADRYLSVRGISNHDRQPEGESAEESFFSAGFEAGFETGLENAVAVARAVVDDRLP
ncbi:phosphorylase [Natronomonas sp. LN261]|jgi:purine nucleoside permease|uniref:phosphorylase family protein n=1 Tax=Natronomonas sp. LN261 TaxID=2750669 RepID=UPI0015EF6DBC|nr:phosphorylase [Natronomonas sp. LN261]